MSQTEIFQEDRISYLPIQLCVGVYRMFIILIMWFIWLKCKGFKIRRWAKRWRWMYTGIWKGISNASQESSSKKKHDRESKKN